MCNKDFSQDLLLETDLTINKDSRHFTHITKCKSAPAIKRCLYKEKIKQIREH